MRIGIDARFASHPQWGGFKSYTENLVGALVALESPHRFFVYVDRPAALSRLDRRRCEVRAVPGTLPVLGPPWREQMALPRHAARDRLDLLHAPAQTAPLRLPCPLVVTIHDDFSLGPVRFPLPARTLHERLLFRYLAVVGRMAGRRAAQVLTVSNFSKAALVRALGLAPERITVTHEAPAAHYRPLGREAARAEVARRFGVRSPFVLHLGSVDGRKNTAAAGRAFAALPGDVARGLLLVIVGGRVAAPSSEAGPVRLLGAVGGDDLLHLYNAASLLLFPSFEEGFGLPPLEAMACGAPVVATATGAMPEVLGAAAALVPPGDVAGLAREVERVLRDPAWSAELSRRGRGRAASFSWQRCAEQTLEAYAEVARRG